MSSASGSRSSRREQAYIKRKELLSGYRTCNDHYASCDYTEQADILSGTYLFLHDNAPAYLRCLCVFRPYTAGLLQPKEK